MFTTISPANRLINNAIDINYSQTYKSSKYVATRIVSGSMRFLGLTKAAAYGIMKVLKARFTVPVADSSSRYFHTRNSTFNVTNVSASNYNLEVEISESDSIYSSSKILDVESEFEFTNSVRTYLDEDDLELFNVEMTGDYIIENLGSGLFLYLRIVNYQSFVESDFYLMVSNADGSWSNYAYESGIFEIVTRDDGLYYVKTSICPTACDRFYRLRLGSQALGYKYSGAKLASKYVAPSA